MEGHKVPFSVHYGYVHRLAHLLGLVLSGRNDSLSFFERDHRVATFSLSATSSTTTRKSYRSIIAHHAVSLVCLPCRTPLPVAVSRLPYLRKAVHSGLEVPTLRVGVFSCIQVVPDLA